MTITKLVIVHGGELAKDVAEQVVAKKPPSSCVEAAPLRSASERPKSLLDLDDNTLVCFVIQTIENGQPTEEAGATVRFFKRRTHPNALLKNSFSFAVLGVGDSNLLLDRQTTTAKDCNQVAQELDGRLEALGGTRFCELALADERTGLLEVERWIDELWDSVSAE